MSDAILEKENKGYVVKVFIDDLPLNPVENFDMLGKMICFHRRYKLGHIHNFTIESFQEFLNENNKKIIYLPLYLYDYSGISIKTTPFDCQWDSGQVGVIYVTKEDIKKEYKVKNITKDIKEKILTYLKTEVETYDRYLTGQVYGYVILKDGDIEDSCYGIYDDPEIILEDCITNIDKNYDFQLELPL